MLEQLFGSKARLEILKLFIDEEGPFYVREIGKKTHLHINSVRRELDNLEKLGLLKSLSQLRGEHDKKYYQLDRDFVLYPEIKALIKKAHLILQEPLINDLNKIGQTNLLVLSGFFVNSSDSPTDVLIVGKFNKNKLNFLMKKFQKDVGQEIRYTILSPNEFKYRRDLTDKFLFNILEQRKIILIDKYKLNGK
ncbi:MAG: winged helix-turn-helix domain-containing protein [Patescibacteria group bacterium]|jgi:DNA-binding transcriptional ArsR family regulator|nr:winged helix-turn-helix domain-containing protein [Patescibacteria group bacterium]